MKEVWLHVEDKVAWVRAQELPLSSTNSGDSVSIRRMDNDAIIHLTTAEFNKLALCMSEATDEVPDDLTAIVDVSDATILDTLRRRYAAPRDHIYTAIGHVTISVNPYRQIADCTSAAIAQCAREGEDAPPHIVRTATIAYHGLTLTSPEDRQPQSILISGETGAGKTEACKLCLLALAELSGSSGAATEQCLESAVLLEAFGNAKTVYNDNSSRFGKWCAVYFDSKFQIAACEASVYLLERTRIVHAPKQERSYHIFYQLLTCGADGRSADNEDDHHEHGLSRAGLRLLPGATPHEYAMLKGGEATVGGIDDGREWCSTLEKLDVVGLVDERRLALMRLVSAVLALGNLSFAPKPGAPQIGGVLQQQVSERGALETACGLLGLVPRELDFALTSRTVSTKRAGSSTYTIALTEDQCVDTRDVLSQALYSRLFDWLVGCLNAAQTNEELLRNDAEAAERFVGLLDIFGFENFEANSFEQLCINFTNEKLQGFFMDALVKLRLDEYDAEGIEHTQIDFPDNSAQLELLDHTDLGIFAALDDECALPEGSDERFVRKLHTALYDRTDGVSASAHECYDKLRRAKGRLVGQRHIHSTFPSRGADLDELSFVVVHYAESVCYCTSGWLEKNRGYLSDDVYKLLPKSANGLVAELFPPRADEKGKKAERTIGSTFRKSLRKLSATMLTTSQSFVRCIKPNGLQQPDNFDGHFVLRQLRYTGVAAVVAIHRSGYPVSLTHQEFVARYRCIALTEHNMALLRGPARVVCSNLLGHGPRLAGLIPPEEHDWLGSRAAQVGKKSRVYLTDEVVRALEAPRLEATKMAVVMVQRRVRGLISRQLAAQLLKHTRAAANVRAAMANNDVDTAAKELDKLRAEWAQGGLKRLFGSSAAEGIWVPLLAAAKQEVEALGHERKPMPRACGLTRHRAATLLRPHAPCAASFPKPSSTSPSVALQSLLTLLARLLIVTAARPQSKRLRTR